MSTRTLSEMKSHILNKAMGDAEFRTNLLADPRAVIAQELEILIPEGFNIQVHQDSANSAHLVLPLSDRLSEEELEKAVGGVDVNWNTVNIS